MVYYLQIKKVFLSEEGIILRQKISKKMVASAIVLFFANVVFFLTIWLLEQYDSICFDQFLYQIKSSTKGSDSILISSGFLYMGGFGGVLTALEIFLFCLLTGRVAKVKVKDCLAKFLNKSALPLVLSIFILSVIFFIYKLEIVPYAKTVNTKTQFLEENYVNPCDVKIQFPQNKRNLIFIFAESTENTYADISSGGQFRDNYIPELCSLAENNINFSNTNGLGGAYSYDGTTWTAGGIVAATSGVTVKIPLFTSAYGRINGFMKGVTTLGDILESNNYNQVILMGSDAEFANRDLYFKQHGGYQILDVNVLKKQGRLPKNYDEWWGFEDQKLFEFAKEELTRLSAEGKPFNLTLLTADTHFPNGYVCSECNTDFKNQYSNVLRCSSKQINNFVQWVKKQSFYDNTTIIIMGDHLTMDPKFMKDIDDEYERTVYNCIINSAVEPKKEKQRQFATFDFCPTTLAALGATIEGERLGLGTNLFSSEETLTEKYGFKYSNEQIAGKSDYYNKKILCME